MKLSLCIPYHDSTNSAFYLSRLLGSVAQQSFTDYEVVITNEGKFARNHNAAIIKAKGEIVQMLQMDDYFAHSEALFNIVTGFSANPEKQWQISACLHDINGQIGNYHEPKWTDDIVTGNNRLGSVSTLSFRRKSALLFEEPLTWLVDVDLYYRLYLKYGLPNMLNEANIIVTERPDRLTHTLDMQTKLDEVQYLQQKYVNNRQ